MNLNVVTIDDCLDMLQKKGFSAVISNGQVIAFVKKEVNDESLQLLRREL